MGAFIIIRGLPGSGKSTRGRQIAQMYRSLFVEPDMFCMAAGTYTYSKDKYELAVKSALNSVADAAGHGADCVYADVLPTLEDVKLVARTYIVNCAQAAHARILVLSFPPMTVEDCMRLNIHDVAVEDLQRMCDSWEIFKDDVIRHDEDSPRWEFATAGRVLP